MPKQFFLTCDVRGRYLLQVGAKNLAAAKRKASVMLIPGMRSPYEAVLWRGSVKHSIRPAAPSAAHRAAGTNTAKRRSRR